MAGHSQGALVAAWLWLFEPESYTPPFLLAGPWAGALLCQTWYPLGAALRSMSSESRFLHEVTEAYASLPADEQRRMTSIFSTSDRVVQLTTAMVAGATNVCVAPAAKHVELSRQFPGIVLIDGKMGHTGLPRSSARPPADRRPDGRGRHLGPTPHPGGDPARPMTGPVALDAAGTRRADRAMGPPPPDQPADQPADPAPHQPGVSTPEPRHYGGDHHRLSVIDQLGGRIDQALDDELLQRDPSTVDWAMPLVDRYLSWFDPEVRGFEHVPAEGPFLVVGNHSGGIYMPDYWAFLRHWVRQRGPQDPLYSMAFDFLFSIPGWGTLARRLGSVPGSQANAARLLASGAPVIVYPGGDEDDYRPWTERHRVDLHGRTGFVKLALRQQVPVIPVVAHGSHDVIIVLARGDALAHRLGFDKLRINIFPVVLGPPWGIAPVQLPTWPLPAKVTVRVCEPIDWTDFPPEAADDPDVVRHCYEDALGRMQSNLDELVAELPASGGGPPRVDGARGGRIAGRNGPLRLRRRPLRHGSDSSPTPPTHDRVPGSTGPPTEVVQVCRARFDWRVAPDAMAVHVCAVPSCSGAC